MFKSIRIAAFILALMCAFSAVCALADEITRYESPYGFIIEYPDNSWVLIDSAMLTDYAGGMASESGLSDADIEAMLSVFEGMETTCLIRKDEDKYSAITIDRVSGYSGINTELLLHAEQLIIQQYANMIPDIEVASPARIELIGANEFLRIDMRSPDAGTGVYVSHMMLVSGDYAYAVSFITEDSDAFMRLEADAMGVLNTLTLVTPED